MSFNILLFFSLSPFPGPSIQYYVVDIRDFPLCGATLSYYVFRGLVVLFSVSCQIRNKTVMPSNHGEHWDFARLIERNQHYNIEFSDSL